MIYRITVVKQGESEHWKTVTPGIILTPSEITQLDVQISDSSKQDISNSENIITVHIQGQLLTHVEDKKPSLFGALGMATLESQLSMGGIQSLTGGLKSGIAYLGQSFTQNLTQTLLGSATNFGGKKNDKELAENIQEQNFKNTIELAQWSLAFGSEEEYRDVIIEMIMNEKIRKTYILPDMYAFNYDELGTVDKGQVNFVFSLKQKQYKARKIKIEKGGTRDE